MNILKREKKCTFEDYAKNVFIPHLAKRLSTVNRLDVVFERYIENSLNSSARNRRSKGNYIRRKVEKISKSPNYWSAFLRVNENKAELFRFLSRFIVSMESEKGVLWAFDGDHLSNNDMDISSHTAYSHEEVDTRVLLHARQIFWSGYEKVCIQTVDTDVLVIVIALHFQTGLKELWIELGTGYSTKQFPIHQICTNLGYIKYISLLFFHSFTGCDQISFFSKCGKRTAWKTWMNLEEVSNSFYKLSQTPTLEDVSRSSLCFRDLCV